MAVTARIRKLVVLVVLATMILAGGVFGSSPAEASDCNMIDGGGHGYWGCGGMDHAWEHGTWAWVMYYW